MKSLGLNLASGQVRFVVLEGSIPIPKFLDKGKEEYDPTLPIPERMHWFGKTFASLIEQHKPDRVSYRLHWLGSMKQTQISALHYPYGILNLYCHEKAIEIHEVTSAGMTAKRFQLPKGTKPLEACDHVIGVHRPYWDDAQRYAACAAWMALE